MTELDDTTRGLVTRLRELNDTATKVDEERDWIKAELRARLASGAHTVDGAAAVQITPTRRFNPDLAIHFLSGEQIAEATKVVFDPAAVKKFLTQAQIDEASPEVGKPTVRLA